MGNDNNTNTDVNNDVDTNNTDNNSTIDNTEVTIDTEAFADLISERDNKISELEREMKILKKNNADLLVKMSAGMKSEKSIEQTILDVCDTRKIR